MARLPQPGGDSGNWGNILNDFLSVSHNNDGTLKVVPITSGGTGASNADDARTNLSAASISAVQQAQTTANAAVPLSTITARGDLLVGTANGAIDNLAIGSDTQVLTASGGTAVWATPTSAPLSANEAAIWKVRAAMLDPSAMVVRSGAYDLTPTNPLYPTQIWNSYITGSDFRFEVRHIPTSATIPPPVTQRLRGASGTASTLSTLIATDPSLVSYTNPQTTWFNRINRLATLTQYSVSFTGTGSGYLATNSAFIKVGPLMSSPPATYVVSKGTGAASKAACAIKLGKSIASGQSVKGRVWISRESGDSGGFTATINTHSSGPATAITDTVVVPEASLPAIGSAGWVEITFGPTNATMDVDTFYWMTLVAETGVGNAFRMPQSEGLETGWINSLVWEGSSWVQPFAQQANTGSHFRYEFWNATEHTTPPNIFVASVSTFDASWTILRNRLSNAGFNLDNEISDADDIRFTHNPMLPWDVTYGNHFEVNNNGTGTLLLYELPSDW